MNKKNHHQIFHNNSSINNHKLFHFLSSLWDHIEGDVEELKSRRNVIRTKKITALLQAEVAVLA